jgi:hypothetical protein
VARTRLSAFFGPVFRRVFGRTVIFRSHRSDGESQAMICAAKLITAEHANAEKLLIQHFSPISADFPGNKPLSLS